ncbi:MAG: hypothetical protein Phog2KO_45280 [Phototrophicaceae bacterium]
MSENKNNKSNLPVAPAGRSQNLDIYRLPQKEANPPVFEGFQTWSDRVRVSTFAFDHLGHLWGSGHGGIVRWIVSPNEIKYKVWQSEHGLAGNDISSMLIASDGRIICGHSSGWLSIFDNDSWQNIDTQTSFSISAVSETPEGNMLACTDVGLFDIDLEVLDSNIPAPPLSSISAFGHLWVGTESGLYFREDEQWKFFESERPFRVVTSMKLAKEKLWFSGYSGAGYINKAGNVHRVPIKEPVRDLFPIGDQVFLAAASGVYIYAESTGELQRTSPHETRAIVASGHQMVQTTEDNVLFIDYQRKEKRWLLPDASDTPGEIQSVHDVEGITYIQCVDNSIWHESKLGWTRLLDKTNLPVTGINKFNDYILLSFMSKKGLGKLVDGKSEFFDKVQYVRQMIVTDEILIILTLNGILQTQDTETWSTSEEIRNAITAYGLPKYLCRTGILYEKAFLNFGDGIELSVDDVHIHDITHHIDTTCIVSHDGVYELSENAVTSPQLASLNDGKSITSYGNELYVGTQNGLLNVSKSNRHLTSNSGIASNSISTLLTTKDYLYILTSCGTTIVHKTVSEG